MATAPKGKRLRRMTDIDRLAQQYNRSINELTGQYETSFSDYQKQVAQQMAPFEEAAAKYKAETLPAFEQQSKDFKKRLEDYQKSLAEVEKNPMTLLGYMKPVKKSTDYFFTESGQTKYLSQINDDDYFVEGLAVYKKNKPPVFTEKAPTAPTAPTVSGAAAFDSSQFEQRRSQIQEEFGRELGERRAGKLAAVSRRSRRPMLQEA